MSDMLVGIPSPSDRELDVLAHLCELILAWPCPNCGKQFPCPCDDQALPPLEDLRRHWSMLVDCSIMMINEVGQAGADNTNPALSQSGVSGSGPAVF